MTSLKTTVVLSAVGIIMLAAPAFAQEPQQQPTLQDVVQAPWSVQGEYDVQFGNAYPNPQTHSGSAESFDSGKQFIGGY